MSAWRPLAAVTVREVPVADLREAVRIDAFVRAEPGSTPFHLTGWSRAVEAGCGQRARYLVAERPCGGIAGVLPLTEVRSPLAGRALVSAGFAVDGGVLGRATDELAAAAWTLAGRLGVRSVELRGGPAPAGWAVDGTTYQGFARPLAADDAGDLAAIPRKQRAEVRRSLALDAEVAAGRSPALLAEHYRVYAESVRNLGTPVFPAGLMRAAASMLDADVLTVRYRGRTVAGVLSLYHDGTVYPYWGGGTVAARGLRANDRLYVELMRHARARGCGRFDFGRSKAGTGAAAFKKNWGFEPRPLRYAGRGPTRRLDPRQGRYAALVAAWKRLPLPVASAVGPWIARGLG